MNFGIDFSATNMAMNRILGDESLLFSYWHMQQHDDLNGRILAHQAIP